MRGPFVVGVDGSDASLYGVQETVAMAAGSRRSIIAVFVRHVPVVAFGAMTAGAAGTMRTVVDESQTLAEAECIALLTSSGLEWQFEVGDGEPACELMRVALEHGADTIVVAGRRHGTLASVACGAITARLLHRWSGALVVLHPPADNGT